MKLLASHDIDISYSNVSLSITPIEYSSSDSDCLVYSHKYGTSAHRHHKILNDPHVLIPGPSIISLQLGVTLSLPNLAREAGIDLFWTITEQN